MKKNNIVENLIAPCGMNCSLCIAHLREKNKCPGCRMEVTKISCLNCKIRNCADRKGAYCFDCVKFPCDRLKNLDKRYKTKYEMSELENLEYIRNHCVEKFIEKESKRWINTEGVYCVHNKKRYLD